MIPPAKVLIVTDRVAGIREEAGAPASHAGGPGFESLRAHHFTRVLHQPCYPCATETGPESVLPEGCKIFGIGSRGCYIPFAFNIFVISGFCWVQDWSTSRIQPRHERQFLRISTDHFEFASNGHPRAAVLVYEIPPAPRFPFRPSGSQLDLSPKLRQPVKSQNSLNGELTHGIVSTKVHA